MKSEEQLKDDWNRQHPAPCIVRVRLEGRNKSEHRRTRSEAFLLFGDKPQAAILIEGYAGYFLLSEVAY